jgi:hypothetical protein
MIEMQQVLGVPPEVPEAEDRLHISQEVLMLL